MKLVLSICRKEGRPGYGSEGATAEVHLELAERTVSENPLSLIEEARRGYAFLDQVVSEQLARTAPDAPPVEPPVMTLGYVHGDPDPPASQTPARDRLPSQGRAPSTPEPARTEPRRPPAPGNGNGQGGPPRDGRALYSWLKRQDEEHDAGLLRYVSRWGKLQEFGERMVEWSQEQVAEALAEATRKLAAVASTN
jgi:hypothetical protein